MRRGVGQFLVVLTEGTVTIHHPRGSSLDGDSDLVMFWVCSRS